LRRESRHARKNRYSASDLALSTKSVKKRSASCIFLRWNMPRIAPSHRDGSIGVEKDEEIKPENKI
jgi:hypothetical protein